MIDSLTVIEKARKLVKKMEEIHADERYISVWILYMIHGGEYPKNLNYEKEFKELKDALE